MEINTNLLQTLGLTDKESLLYTLLIELGQVQANVLITKTGLKRATVYKALYSLEARGLIRKLDIHKKLHFAPLPPENLIRLSDEAMARQEKAQADIRSLIPTLTSQYIMSVEKPVISTFEGVEGLKKIYEDTLKEKKPIYAVLQTAEVEERLMEWLERTYAKRRYAAQIHADVIVASGEWSEEYIKRRHDSFTTTRLVDSVLYPFAHEVDIYGDKVAFIHYKKGDALIGIVIHHPSIAQTMKALFDLAWKGTQV